MGSLSRVRGGLTYSPSITAGEHRHYPEVLEKDYEASLQLIDRVPCGPEKRDLWRRKAQRCNTWLSK